MKRAINVAIAFFSFEIAYILAVKTDWMESWFWITAAVLFAIVHVGLALKKGRADVKDRKPTFSVSALPDTTLTEVALLGEDDTQLAFWNIYGKNGIVIGRDIGENNVTINLDNSTYASMIDIEHAVLNYSGDCWYIEDISEKNGVSIQKQDGRKYRLAYGKPCRLEKGDIIYIALTRLQIL